jgi:hypothetical protein
VNINNILTKLRRDGAEREYEVRLHSATGCCSMIVSQVRYLKNLQHKPNVLTNNIEERVSYCHVIGGCAWL